MSGAGALPPASFAGLHTTVVLTRDRPDGTSVDLTLFAVLDDGSRHLLLDDRGFGWRVHPAGTSNWWGATAEDLAATARMCVGPDEPWEGETYEEASAAHWGALADSLFAVCGVRTTAAEMGAAPHEVTFDDAITQRLRDAPGPGLDAS